MAALLQTDVRTDGEDTADGFTQTRVTNNRSVRNSWGSLFGSCSPVSVGWSVGRWFACADAVVSFRFLARTSSRPGSSLRVGFIPLGSASRQQQRSAVAAGPLGGLQTSRIRQIQLTRAELNRRNPLTVRSSLARSEYSALPFSFDRLSHLPSVCPSNPTFPLVLRPTLEYTHPSSIRLLFASTTHGFPDVRSKREISEGERGSSSVEFSQSGSPLRPRTRVQRRGKKREGGNRWRGGRKIVKKHFLISRTYKRVAESFSVFPLLGLIFRFLLPLGPIRFRALNISKAKVCDSAQRQKETRKETATNRKNSSPGGSRIFLLWESRSWQTGLTTLREIGWV